MSASRRAHIRRVEYVDGIASPETRAANDPRLARGALERATNLVTVVRDEGADGIASILDPLDRGELYALVTVLAAMVPDDRPVSALLGWLDVPLCGTEAGYQWHRHAARTGRPGAAWPLPADDPCGCRRGHADHVRATKNAARSTHDVA